MGDTQNIGEHYAHSTLEQALLDALSLAGKDSSRLTHADLAPVDEFHIGGRQATDGLHGATEGDKYDQQS